MAVTETVYTLAEVAERLKVNDDTVRRMFMNEPGVIVICFPRRGGASIERCGFLKLSLSA